MRKEEGRGPQHCGAACLDGWMEVGWMEVGWGGGGGRGVVKDSVTATILLHSPPPVESVLT